MRIELCGALREIKRLAAYLSATPQGAMEGRVLGLATDSREVLEGDLFVALQGAQTNGADHAGEALKRGAVAVLAQHGADLPQGCPALLVDHVRAALLGAAARYRRDFGGRLIAVSGSAGKTTVKEAVAAMLALKGSVAHSKGNFNSDIGLSLSLLSFEPCDFWVVEIGISHPGEMAPMAYAAAPNLAVLTNVGSAHIGHFGSREALLSEKARLTAYLGPNGCALIPADLPASAFSCEKTALFRFGRGGEFYLTEISTDQNGTRGDLITPRRVITNLNWSNAGTSGVAVLETVGAVGVLMGLDDGQIRRGLAIAGAKTPRMRRIEAGGRLLIDDSYNASPEAMLEALRVLSLCAGERPTVAVLGDMLELGELTEALHAQVGRAVAEQCIDLLVTYGPCAAIIAETAVCAGLQPWRVLTFEGEQRAALVDTLCARLPQGAAVLFKASGKMRLGELAREVAKRL